MRAWPSAVTILLPIRSSSFATRFDYLHRGSGAIAFRVPALRSLRNLLARTGPLVAPSANYEGEKPTETIAEAKRYFGRSVQYYVDKGRITGEPSTIVTVRNGKIVVLRRGAFVIDER